MSNAPVFVFPAPTAQSFFGWGSLGTGLGAAASPTGFSTFHVNSLLDSGTGTLRDALSQGARYIVFDVGGTIVITSDLNITHSYTTIDGTTAPAPGITIQQGLQGPPITGFPDSTPGVGTNIEGPINDVVIIGIRNIGPASYINVPLYPHANPTNLTSSNSPSHFYFGSNSPDIWGIDGGGGLVTRVLIDHCSFHDTTDGVCDRFRDSSYLTVSNCLITGNDVMCNSINGSGSVVHPRDKETWFRNVFAKNSDRVLRQTGATRLIDFVNNIIYGIEWWANCSFSSPLFKGVMSLGDTLQNPGAVGWDMTMNIEDNWLMNPVIVPRGGSGTGGRARNDCWIGNLNVGAPQQLIWIANNVYDLVETTQSSAIGHIDMGAAEVPHVAAGTLKTALLAGVGAPYRTQFEIDLINEIQAYHFP